MPAPPRAVVLREASVTSSYAQTQQITLHLNGTAVVSACLCSAWRENVSWV